MLNLILDLDETLIQSVKLVNKNISYFYNLKLLEFFYINYKSIKEKIKTKKIKKKGKTKKKGKYKTIYKNHNYLIFQRTNLRIFLKFCFKHFNVGFWTNGDIKYGKEIIKNLLTPEEIKKCFCLIYRTKYDSYNMHYKDDVAKKRFKIKMTNGYSSKDLKYIYNKKITKKNTILFDDALYNKAMNCGNTILIPKFTYNIKNDDCLFKLMKYLDKIKKHKKIGNLKIIQDDLFKNYKINENWKIGKKKYEEGDNISSEAIINSKNNNTIISKVNKNSYDVMYINKNNNKLEEKNINHSDVNYKFIYS